MPTIALDGSLSILYRPDMQISYELNEPGAFTGNIINRENIGKTGDQLVDKWNMDKPEDPVTE